MPAYCRFKADRENDFVVVLPIAFIANFTAYVQVNRCFQPTIRPYLGSVVRPLFMSRYGHYFTLAS